MADVEELDVFDPRERLVGAFPRGPLQLPPIGHHWYVVEEVGFPDPETFTATFERLGSWLGMLAERTGVPIERTVLGGFIPTVPDFELQLDGLAGLPVTITHGLLDPVISVELGRQSRDRAKAAGADVVYRETDVPAHRRPPDRAGARRLARQALLARPPGVHDVTALGEPLAGRDVGLA